MSEELTGNARLIPVEPDVIQELFGGLDENAHAIEELTGLHPEYPSEIE